MALCTAGSAAQLGAHVTATGVNFCLYSRAARGVTLHLFAKEEDSTPSSSIVLDSTQQRSGDRWHVHVEACRAGQLYLYTVDGPYAPRQGLCFNRHKFLQDPYAKAACRQPKGCLSAESLAGNSLSNIAVQSKCMVVADNFDWQGDRPLNYPLADCIIYEAHLKGMTQNCRYANPGTYLGVIEHIPYLQKLAISSVEFLPLMNFSPYDYSERSDPVTGEPLGNYWGYNTRNFFAPATHYATRPEAAVTECKQMVRALHDAGIEIIMDVVFNHSGEANELGPILSFRGLDNLSYYILQDDRRLYVDYAGCGNVLNCNHPIVRQLIIDCLHYWVLEMHIDGFRFDLASIFRRDQRGKIIDAYVSLVEDLSQDSILATTKLIAEPWDGGGAYLLGDFGQSQRGQRQWAEWNDQYRDTVRQFWNGGLGIAQLATRLAGSSDIFWRPQQRPFHSINFLSCHDGYTLRDLFSYNEKHNLRNGERNRDGHNHNFNRNYGIEGPAPSAIARRRCRMVKNHLATLLLSAGTPMLLSGDELGNSQQGNNNVYCQDNDLSWLQYEDNLGRDPEFGTYQSLQRFTAQLIALRRHFAILRRREFFHDNEIRWYGMKPQLCELRRSEQWQRQNSCLGMLLESNFAHSQTSPSLFCIFNATEQQLNFPLPSKPSSQSPYSESSWRTIIDTALPAPKDICLPFGPYARTEESDDDQTRLAPKNIYPVAAQSVVVFMG